MDLSGLPSGSWTLTQTQGGITATGSGASATIIGLAPGTYTYTVTNSLGCVSIPSSNIVITTQPVTPSPPVTGTITPPSCTLSTGSIALSGLPPTGTWTLTRSPGGLTTTGTGTNRTISGLAEGTYSYTVTNSAGCTSASSPDVVIPGVPPNPVVTITDPAPVCAPLRADLTAVSVTSGSTAGLTFTYWINSAATIAYATPSAAAAGTYYIKGTTSTGCFDIKPVTVTVNPSPTANAGAGGNECDLDFRLNAVPGIGTGTWTKTTGPGMVIFAPNTNLATALVSVSEYGTYTFTWTEVSGLCSKSSVISVNFNEQPVANAGIGGNNCGLDFFFNATLTVGTGTWTRVSGPGSATFSPNSSTPGARVTVTIFGSYTFKWTVINGVCSSSETITVNFIQQLSGNAGTGGSECDKDFIFNATPTAGVGTWTLVTGPGNAIFTPDNHQPNAKVTVDMSGTYNFAWTIVNNTCKSSNNVSVVFHDLPIVTAGIDLAICKVGSIQIHAEGTGSFSWAPVSLVNNPNIANTIATPVVTSTFTVTLTDQFGCKNSDDVIVEVRQNPVANAGPDKVFDHPVETTMNAELAHPFESGVWSIISGAGNFSDVNDANSTINSLSPGQNIFLWTVTNGVCAAADDAITISIHDLNIPTLITPNMDGRNEYFILNGLATLGKTELTVFDRRGAMVFKNVNYDNLWNGVDYNSNPLPDDTYFYVVRSEKGLSMSGFIVIRR